MLPRPSPPSTGPATAIAFLDNTADTSLTIDPDTQLIAVASAGMGTARLAVTAAGGIDNARLLHLCPSGAVFGPNPDTVDGPSGLRFQVESPPPGRSLQGSGVPLATVLKMLLAERHLKNHSDFLPAYDRCAAQLDPPIPPGYGPAKTQFYRWLSGSMVGIPRDYHCRVLVKMFPGWTIESLFQMADAVPIDARAHELSIPGTDIELEAFLGAEMITSGITLVYPTFELPLRRVQARRAAEAPYRCTFGRKVRAFAADQHSDVLTALPEKEVRGLLYVFSVFQRHTGIVTEIRSDRDVVADNDRPYISFGLTCNDCTRMYLESAERPLFTLNGSGAEGGSHFEQLELTDGSRFDSSADRSIGVIARVRPSRYLHPDRYWIFCAGLGPRGTTGASWYLANSWSPLQRRAGDREFVAVVGVGKNSDDTAHLEHLLIESASS